MEGLIGTGSQRSEPETLKFMDVSEEEKYNWHEVELSAEFQSSEKHRDGKEGSKRKCH